MDRDAIARGRRRDEALEALEFERGREAALHDQIGAIVHEEERERIDRDAFDRMEPRDSEIVREILGDADVLDDSDEGEDEDWTEMLADMAAEPTPDVEHSLDEIERLRTEIETSKARQRALERFLRALEQTAPAGEQTAPAGDVGS